MTEESQGIINTKKIPGAILLCMVVLVAVFSISGTAFGLLQSQADLLYCSRATNVLCPPACNTAAVMLATGVDNCNSSQDPNGIGYCPTTTTLGFVAAEIQCTSAINAGISTLYLQKTTKTAFSSSTFTNIVSGSGWVTPIGFVFNVN